MILRVFFILGIFLHFFSFDIFSQERSYIVVCDTLTVSGYEVVVSNRNKKTELYDTYFGFINDSIYFNSYRLKEIIDSSNKKKVFKNISHENYLFLKNEIQFALLHDGNLDMEIALYNNCEESFRETMYTVVNSIFRPHVISYSIREKEVNVKKQLYCCTKLKMRYLLIKYDSYDLFIKEQVVEALLNTQPINKHLLFNFHYPINLMPISNACRDDGYYILVPVEILPCP